MEPIFKREYVMMTHVNASDSRGKDDSKIERGMAGSTTNSIKEMVNNESLSRGSFMDG
jgi:hypothetical protein